MSECRMAATARARRGLRGPSKDLRTGVLRGGRAARVGAGLGEEADDADVAGAGDLGSGVGEHVVAEHDGGGVVEGAVGGGATAAGGGAVGEGGQEGPSPPPRRPIRSISASGA